MTTDGQIDDQQYQFLINTFDICIVFVLFSLLSPLVYSLTVVYVLWTSMKELRCVEITMSLYYYYRSEVIIIPSVSVIFLIKSS